ncbi:hypothetical protein TIFTF001_055381 [Ficus carica]|uniref:Protein kinase domain-containing protein n=1 Tax=Ficus carica TaxID=3494 RepID=A0AA88ENI4_FICCA|nr:hypothetical protein TIFTF001_055381 [Ficus carica]
MQDTALDKALGHCQRIFGDDEKEEKTKRIVGTYGYMSPEYAIDGKFSVISDVFSFGVVLLETGWLLWNEGKALNLMDVCLKDSYVESQVLRCIQVGLLCVQKFPNDRPTMSSVVFMLENDGAVLPEPKQPGFFVERSSGDVSSSTSLIDQDSHSENVATTTMPYGR